MYHITNVPYNVPYYILMYHTINVPDNQCSQNSLPYNQCTRQPMYLLIA